MNRIQHLAAYTVFKDLYDEGKKNIFNILIEFVKEIIIEDTLIVISPNEMTELLTEKYSIKVPVSVINTTLKKIEGLKSENKKFIVENGNKIKSDIDEKLQANIQETSFNIIEKLENYVESKNDKKLTDADKSKLLNNLFSFLLVDQNGNEYSELISAFIIENKDNTEIVKRLESIKEGIIIYQGINYDNTPNSIASWNQEITFYLEADVIFHFCGLNGEVFKKIFLDFYDLVKRINQEKGKNIIKLKYFKETEEEIDAFFYKAECIKKNSERLDPSITAMVSILEGCVNASDIQNKKSDLFLFLKENKISVETDQDFYYIQNHGYNLEDFSIYRDKEIVDHPKNDYYLKLISHVHVKRKGSLADKIQQSGYILITENSRINYMSKCINQDENCYSIPLSMSLSSITTKLWVQTNSGLGAEKLPQTFKLVSKAQVLLSKHLSDKVGKDYEELVKKIRDGSLTNDQIKHRYLNLLKQSKKPEDILKDELEDIMYNLNLDEMDSFIKNYESEKEKITNIKKNNIDLKNNVTEMEIKLKNSTKNLKSKEEESAKNKMIAEKTCEEKYKLLQKIKNNCEKEIAKKKKQIKKGAIVGFCAYMIVVILLFIFVKWDYLEPAIAFITIFISLSGYLYFFITSKEFKPVEIQKNYSKRIDKYVYEKNCFNLDEFNEVKIQLQELRKR